jgi:hypothetical protein
MAFALLYKAALQGAGDNARGGGQAADLDRVLLGHGRQRRIGL